MTNHLRPDTLQRLTNALLSATDPDSEKNRESAYFEKDIALLIRQFFPTFLDLLVDRQGCNYPIEGEKTARRLFDGSRVDQVRWEGEVGDEIEDIFSNLRDDEFTWTAHVLHTIDYPGVDRAIVKIVEPQWREISHSCLIRGGGVLLLQAEVEEEIRQVVESGYDADLLSYRIMGKHWESQFDDDPWVVLDSALADQPLPAIEEPPSAEDVVNLQQGTPEPTSGSEKSTQAVEEPELSPRELHRRKQDEAAERIASQMLMEGIEEVERSPENEQDRGSMEMARLFFKTLLNIVLRDVPVYDVRDGASAVNEWTERAQEAVYRVLDRLEDWDDGWSGEVFYQAHSGGNRVRLASMDPTPMALDVFGWAHQVIEHTSLRDGQETAADKFSYCITNDSNIHDVRVIELDSRNVNDPELL